jgi:hypothetical protein
VESSFSLGLPIAVSFAVVEFVYFSLAAGEHGSVSTSCSFMSLFFHQLTIYGGL